MRSGVVGDSFLMLMPKLVTNKLDKQHLCAQMSKFIYQFMYQFYVIDSMARK